MQTLFFTCEENDFNCPIKFVIPEHPGCFQQSRNTTCVVFSPPGASVVGLLEVLSRWAVINTS